MFRFFFARVWPKGQHTVYKIVIRYENRVSIFGETFPSENTKNFLILFRSNRFHSMDNTYDIRFVDVVEPISSYDYVLYVSSFYFLRVWNIHRAVQFSQSLPPFYFTSPLLFTYFFYEERERSYVQIAAASKMRYCSLPNEHLYRINLSFACNSCSVSRSERQRQGKREKTERVRKRKAREREKYITYTRNGKHREIGESASSVDYSSCLPGSHCQPFSIAKTN